MYSTPQPETQLIHNLEHGGIVIWYDPEALDDASIESLTSYVEHPDRHRPQRPVQVHPQPVGRRRAAAGARRRDRWRWLLELETADTDAIDEFAREHYGNSPEPNGGPRPPG